MLRRMVDLPSPLSPMIRIDDPGFSNRNSSSSKHLMFFKETCEIYMRSLIMRFWQGPPLRIGNPTAGHEQAAYHPAPGFTSDAKPHRRYRVPSSRTPRSVRQDVVPLVPVGCCRSCVYRYWSSENPPRPGHRSVLQGCAMTSRTSELDCKHLDDA